MIFDEKVMIGYVARNGWQPVIDMYNKVWGLEINYDETSQYNDELKATVKKQKEALEVYEEVVAHYADDSIYEQTNADGTDGSLLFMEDEAEKAQAKVKEILDK